jgi:hypothetical protein
MRIDIGLPLLEKLEIDQFYVDSNSQQFIRYKEWLESSRSQPMMITGQIGSGKTTFIHYGCLTTSIKPDIQIKFDTEPVDYTISAFTALVFAKTLRWFTNDWKADLSTLLMPEIIELFPNVSASNFTELLAKKWISSKEERAKQKGLFNVIKANLDFVHDQIDDLLNKVDYNFKKDVLVFAEGIDKFQPNSPEYFELEPVLEILKRHKTLFETNLVHYFTPSKIWGKDIQKVIIPAVSELHIIDCLKKRLGQFYIVYKNMMQTVAELSGGNYRQALRLLAEYEFASTNLKKSKDDAINYSINHTIDNLLSFSSVRSDLETLNVINRDQFITSGVAQKNTDLIFNNNIFILSELSDLQWKCIINPLLQENLKNSNPSDSNLDPINSWVSTTGTTITGLSNSSFDKAQLSEYLSGFKTTQLSISETFTALSSLFLSDSNEIVVVLYENKEVAEVANDYFLGNVGNVTDLKFSKTIQLKKIENILSLKGSFDVSTLFLESYDKRFLRSLDHLRDYLITKNMLWWVKQSEILKCLEQWPQLRQFLKIYSLDESIRAFITIDEIKEDLSALKEMGYTEKTYTPFKTKLERVLNYLKKGGNHD